ncbi:hypothetical protein K227x_48450 [Rubripirellula lacrimiformis]|uniref:3-keto-alpha-glucoside-1,2-lyase/3-keto-2-hydroxy-glucal hydratase domain-containing protein n=1 Tax=Rubripirellula lacrimiformis TaxID=1930273 RepID=A0A517NH25_9BACT|nr:DUF1080 domain-containing protein [Rubripirellula lacrimiformis]QDT06435.1 hypothetical protein K227x_48450 [Rubripirellula lacrimiformis]
MKKSLLLFSAMAAAIGFGNLVATCTVSAEDIPSGFTSIFDGKTLDGWDARPHFSPIEFKALSDDARAEKMSQWMAEAKQHWSVENGELVNDGSGPYLVSAKDYTDYELVIDYKTVPKADSGIYLKGSPQVQIWDFTDTTKFKLGADKGSGGLWNNSAGAAGKDPAVLADKPFGQWNRFRIIQIGARTTVYLNDQLVVDNAIMENYWDRESPLFRSGPIELQTHGGEIRWRNIAVKELSAEEANEYLSSRGNDGFTSLFDGKSLDGWQGSPENYEVVDGAIRCQQGKGGLLLTKDEYKNFVARVEFRLPAGGNNGLAIRAPLGGDAAYSAMTELQVLDSEHPKYAKLDSRQYHGSAYGMAAATRGYLRDVGQWNYQEVTVDGMRIKVELNGNVILDTDLAEAKDFLADKKHPGLKRETGHFGFAGHNDPVEFRNVSIKQLP